MPRRQALDPPSDRAVRMTEEQQASQPHFRPWESHRAGLLRMHFWAHSGESHQEQAAWIYQG